MIKTIFGIFKCECCDCITIKTSPTQRYCKLCKPHIKLEHQRRRKRKKSPLNIIECEICGKDFKQVRTNQKYCSECKKYTYNKSTKNWRDLHSSGLTIRKCRECGMNFFQHSGRHYICKECIPENKLKIGRKRRTKLRNLKEDFSISEWHEKLDKTQGVCPRCGKFVGKDKLTIDHIVPISKAPDGFIYTIDDVQPLCRYCNSSKGSKTESFIY